MSHLVRSTDLTASDRAAQTPRTEERGEQDREFPSTVFIYCPRGVRTGGPEALHQLASTLHEVGVPAVLIPLPGTETRAPVEEYEHYGCVWSSSLAPLDVNGAYVVVPEKEIGLLADLRHATRCVWWLSVDYSSIFEVELAWKRGDRRGALRRVKKRLLRAATGKGLSLRRERQICRSSLNLTQSMYAWSWVYSRLGVVPSMLSDYTSLHSFDSKKTGQNRRPLVAFNPAKGGEYIPALQRLTPEIDWLPIKGMTREEVVEALQQCDIYLDLGPHPGKDRLPREAALAGAITMVARRGSGAFSADTPLPWEYKIDISRDIEATAATAAERLRSALADRAPAEMARSRYAEWVRNERATFTEEVTAIFVRGQCGQDARTPLPLPTPIG